MKQGNKSFSSSIGMDRDSHPSTLKKEQYTFAKNVLFEENGGSGFLVQNEPSNIKCINFPKTANGSQYQVVGFEQNQYDNYTLYLLAAPEGTSMIGKVDYMNYDDNHSDYSVGGCNGCNRLEEIDTNISYCNDFIPLLSDECSEDKCLNFSIHHPFKKGNIQIKKEKCGTVVYLTDFYNTTRYLNLSDLEKYKYLETNDCTGDKVLKCEDCDQSSYVKCPNCDLMRVFPLYKEADLEIESVSYGGNLPQGSYEVLVAYSDIKGNEVSGYFGKSSPARLFDTENVVQTTENFNRRTGYGLKVVVKNIDTKFKYYKVAIVYRTPLSSHEKGTPVEVYSEGVHPTTDSSVLIYDINSMERMSINDISIPPVVYEKTEMLATGNGYLFHGGLVPAREINLQPVFNLMGAFLRWRTIKTKEGLYSNAANTSKYGTYLRDEIYPFGVSVKMEGGYTSRKFILANRPPSNDFRDLENFRGDSASSVSKNSDCSENKRTKRWQFLSTATNEGLYLEEADNEDSDTVTQSKTKYCSTEPKRIENITIAIPDDLEIRDGIGDYIVDNIESLVSGQNPYSPYFSDIINEFQDLSVFGDCDVHIDSNCENKTLKEESAKIEEVGGEIEESDEKPFSDYNIGVYKEQTYFTKTNSSFGVSEKYQEDQALVSKLGEEFGGGSKNLIYRRNYNGGNTSIDNAHEIELSDEYDSGEGNIVYARTIVVKEEEISSMFTDIPSGEAGSVGDRGAYFDTNLSKNVFWYKASINNDEILGLEISKVNKFSGEKDYFMKSGGHVRVSLYSKDGESLTLKYSKIFYETEGLLKDINKDDYNKGEVYIAIDFPVDKSFWRTFVKVAHSSTPSNGIKLSLRKKEYVNRRYTVDFISFSKRQSYELECEYSIESDNGCDYSPYEWGRMGYYESGSKYPCNPELFDSSTLKIKKGSVPDSIKEEFESFFTEGDNGTNYALNDNTDLRNSNIRHYRFPDNTVSPFMDNTQLLPFTENNIYPIGVYLDKEVVNFFLDVAVDNSLLTKEERDKIYEIEIFRGDRSLNRSIVAKGVMYDMYSYRDGDVKSYYSNYPYNDLGDDILNSPNSSRSSAIKHPFGGRENDKFTFHSADTHFHKPKLGNELMVEGYQFGNSRGRFSQVKGHPSWVLLGRKAYKNARNIAIAEGVFELATKTAEFIINSAETTRVAVVGGVTNGGSANPVGAGASAAAIAAYAVAQVAHEVVETGRRAYEWQKIFYNNGNPLNFSYYYSSEGFYNFFQAENSDNNRLRGINKHRYLKGSSYSTSDKSGTIFINNRDRESSVYLDLERSFKYPDEYKEYDNRNLNEGSNSRFISSDTDCEVYSEVVRNIASPYVSIKRWDEDLFGDIYDINWIRSGYIRIDDGIDENVIFGGDNYITRLSLKRKIPFFQSNAMELSMDVPFQYSKYSNIGYAMHYIDFNSGQKGGVEGALFPNVAKSSYGHADCLNGDRSTYVGEPTKFYLWYYGIPQFLVESDINCDFRYMGSRKEQSFYPSVGDYMEWTQELNISIREDNFFLYNPVFTQNDSWFGNNMLPIDYKRAAYECFQNEPNGVMYSLQDNSEKTFYDPNLYYRPLDKYEFKWSGGKLIDLVGVQSEQIFARFENHISLFNAVDEIKDRVLGIRGNEGKGHDRIFSERRLDSIITDIGYGGTQHKEHVSCEYGIFFPDMRRGQVFQMALGGSTELKEVTKGMRNWFKEHLPFKILKGGIEGLTDLDLDNKFKGLGVAMGWDSRFKRVFLTKKDFIVRPEWEGKLKYENNKFYIDGTYNEVELPDTTYFKDVSFTVAYSPLTQTWIGYYDFKPNYYVEHHNFFKTGINNKDVSSLWAHLVTNKSFTTFYGTKYPWSIEVPLIEEAVTDVLQDVTYWMDSTRFHNYFDRAENRKVGMSKAWVYNYSMNTGQLDLITREKNNLYQELQYPKWKGSSMEILATEEDKHWNFNTFYNRVRDEFRNVPNWIVDENDIDKKLNNRAFYTQENWKDRMRGDWFLLRLESDKNHSHKQIFKWGISGVQHYF